MAQNRLGHCTIRRQMGLPTVLSEMLDGGVAIDRDGVETPLHSNVSMSDAQRLYDLVRARRPEVTLELGFAQGISALAIAQALEDNGCGTHHIVDPFENSLYGGVGLTSLDRAGFATGSSSTRPSWKTLFRRCRLPLSRLLTRRTSSI